MKKRSCWVQKLFIVGLLFQVGTSLKSRPVFAEDTESETTAETVITEESTSEAEEEPSPEKVAALPRTDGAQRITADNLVWTPSSPENLLGGADDFNAILFDSLVNFHEMGGPVAAGTLDNVNIVTFVEGLTGGINQFSDYSIPKFNVSLIAQHGIKNKKTQVQNGDVLLGDADSQSMIERYLATGDVFMRSEIASFMQTAKADLTALNQRLWALAPTGEASLDDYSRIELTINSGLNVFELDPSVSTGLNIIDDSTDSTIIIKVKGNQLNFRSIDLNGIAINYENINHIANRVLWVFDPAVSGITFHATNLTGSVLAPASNITFSGGYSAINGTLIANQLNGSNSSSELHYVGRYIGKLSDPITPTDPEDPTEPEEPQDPTNPEDPENPGESQVPEDPTDPTNPEEPVDPEEPKTPNQTLPQTGGEGPKETPKQPVKPKETVKTKPTTTKQLPQTGEALVLEKMLTTIGVGVLFVAGRFYLRQQS